MNYSFPLLKSIEDCVIYTSLINQTLQYKNTVATIKLLFVNNQIFVFDNATEKRNREIFYNK